MKWTTLIVNKHLCRALENWSNPNRKAALKSFSAQDFVNCLLCHQVCVDILSPKFSSYHIYIVEVTCMLYCIPYKMYIYIHHDVILLSICFISISRLCVDCVHKIYRITSILIMNWSVFVCNPFWHVYLWTSSLQYIYWNIHLY